MSAFPWMKILGGVDFDCESGGASDSDSAVAQEIGEL